MSTNRQQIKVMLDSFLGEHEVIQQSEKSFISAVDEQEVLLLTQPDILTPEVAGGLKDKRANLRIAIDNFRSGMLAHIKREEEGILFSVTEIMMRGLMKEHQEIQESLNRIEEIIFADIKPTTSRNELLARHHTLKQAIGDMVELVKRHESAENGIFRIVLKGITEEHW